MRGRRIFSILGARLLHLLDSVGHRKAGMYSSPSGRGAQLLPEKSDELPIVFLREVQHSRCEGGFTYLAIDEIVVGREFANEYGALSNSVGIDVSLAIK